MITFEDLRAKGYSVEVNTTGTIIVDIIDQDNTDITDLDNVTYIQKNIIFDDVEQTYNLIEIATYEIVFSTDDYDQLVSKIKEIIQASV